MKDSVPPVRSEPGNSNDQREFHYEFNGESQGPVSFLDLQRLVRQEVVTNTSVKFVTLSRQSSRRRHHRELRSNARYTPPISSMFCCQKLAHYFLKGWWYPSQEPRYNRRSRFDGAVPQVGVVLLNSSAPVQSVRTLWVAVRGSSSAANSNEFWKTVSPRKRTVKHCHTDHDPPGGRLQ